MIQTPSTKSVTLIRHGESEANAGGVTSDYDTIALSELGHRQADEIANAFNVSPDWVGVSPYLRARQTAQPFLNEFPHIPVHELAVQEFTYLASSKSADMDAESRQPIVDEYWSRMSPEYCDGEDAESFSQFFGRVTTFLGWTKSQPGNGVVFTHGQFIKAVILTAMYPRPTSPTQTMDQFFAIRSGLPIANAAIVRLKYDGAQWWIGSIDCSHLRGAATS